MKILKYNMNRKNFALTYLSAIAAMGVFPLPLLYFSDFNIYTAGAGITGVIALSIMLISNLRRLENIGKSKLWFLGLILPPINLYAFPMLWAYPPNVKKNGIDKKGVFIFILALLFLLAVTALQLVLSAMVDQETESSVEITRPIEAPVGGWASFRGVEAEIVIPRCAGLFSVFHEIAEASAPSGVEYDGGYIESSELALSFSVDQAAARKAAALYQDAYSNRISQRLESNPNSDWLADDELLLTDWRHCQFFGG